MKPTKCLFNYGLTIIILIMEGVSTCGIHVCLTWKIIPNHLVLTCKVDDLHQIVLIDDNFDKEQGYCLSPHPKSSCRNEYDNGTIYQNLNLNETIFSVRGIIDSRVNGNWTCRHGTSKDKVTVEVTIPVPMAVTEIIGPTHQEQIEKNISNKIEGIAGKLDCCRRVKRVTYQKTVVTIVLCVVILLPVALGLEENEKCHGILIHIFLGILGMACGLLISFFIWSTKKQDDINATRPVEQSLLETVTI